MIGKAASLAACLLLTSCANNQPPATPPNVPGERQNAATKPQEDKTVAFQKKAIPIVKDAIHRHFPVYADYAKQADLYYDNDAAQGERIVVHATDLEEPAIVAFRQELGAKLGDAVVFKQAKYSPQWLRDKADEIAEDIGKMTAKSYSVGYEVQHEAVHIMAELTEAQVSELTAKYGADILKITNEDPKITTTD
ncbi:hypothetical protein [Paenibacillus methanolicus]|uniref:Uncharacterized protein n=1 Tax=Paenibacillus methanolicus TaxID=582686 RepID=A0A5S5BYM4_9BACL|nr:hypothetical protein [Paenibacillus methanolicus]TYP70763.1 hypothetical protein BCM02_111271 [Paenibacillus methanolicus]